MGHTDHAVEKAAPLGLATLDAAGQTPLAQLPGAAGRLDNLVATTNPTVDDDSDDGYGIGSVWTNTTSKEYFVCLDATIGAAVWTSTTTAAPPDCYEAEDETTDSTDGATFTPLTDQSITPVAGEYEVDWSGEISGANNRAIEIAIFVGGVQHNSGAGTQQRAFQNTAIGSMSASARVTVNGAQAIDIQYRSATTGEVSCYRKGFSLTRVTAAN